jgi:putative membrane protein
MLSNRLLIAGLSVLLTQGISLAQDQQKGAANRSALNASDQKFIMDAAKGGHHEVEFAKLGTQKATNSAVKDLAQRLLDDHTKANTELEAIAKDKGITLPKSHPPDPVHTKLSGMSGAAFDKEFVNQAIMDHQKDIAAFEKESKSGADAQVRDFATKTLPTLRAHLDQAKAIKL